MLIRSDVITLLKLMQAKETKNPIFVGKCNTMLNK